MSFNTRRLASAILAIAILIVSACSSGSGATDAVAPEVPLPADQSTPDQPTGDAVTGLHRYKIVPEESQASYLVDEEFFGGALSKYGIAAGTVDTVGSTNAIEGHLELNLDDLSSALGDNQFTVDLSTLTSDQSLRDQWLRRNGPGFNEYPIAKFVATAIEAAPTAYSDGEQVSFSLSGEMTIREITNPATFEVTAALSGDTLSGTATGQLLMSDYGFEPPDFANTLTVADEFQVHVEFTAKEE